MKAFNYFLFGCLLVTAYGCVTTKVDLADSSTSYEPTSKVEFLYEKPSRPYKVIAVIKGRGSRYRKESLVFDKIMKRAKKIGAQAIITLHSSVSYPVHSTIDKKKPIDPVDDAVDRAFENMEGSKFKLEVAAIRFVDSQKEDSSMINGARDHQ